MLAQMIGLRGIDHSPAVPACLGYRILDGDGGLLAMVQFRAELFEIAYTIKLRKRYAVIAGATMALCILKLGTPVDFLYFRF